VLPFKTILANIYIGMNCHATTKISIDKPSFLSSIVVVFCFFSQGAEQS